MRLELTTFAMARRRSSQLSYIRKKSMERGTGFEPAHPRVEALVHSLFYVTPARLMRGYCIKRVPIVKKISQKEPKKYNLEASYF